MDAGASRQHHNQDQRFSHERENKEIKQKVNVAPVNKDKASPNDILERYKAKYPDQAESLETMLNRIQGLKKFVDSNLNDHEDYTKVGKQIIDSLRETSVNTSESAAGTHDAKQFTTLIKFIIDVGGAEELKRFAEHCFKKYSYVLKESDNGDESDEEPEEYTCYECLCDTLAIMQNFSDFHQGFCSACANAGVISMCFENIKRIDAENSNWEEEDEDSELLTIIDSSIGILHNISRRLRDRELFANREQTLLYFAKKKVPAIAVQSLLTLAYLVDESTNHLILADKKLLSFIIKLLDEAWQSEDRCSNQYSAKELAEGLSHLAINDRNKKILVWKGVVPVLVSVFKTSSDEEEKANATRALRMLAFDDNNKEAIPQEDGAVVQVILRQLQHSQEVLSRLRDDTGSFIVSRK